MPPSTPEISSDKASLGPKNTSHKASWGGPVYLCKGPVYPYKALCTFTRALCTSTRALCTLTGRPSAALEYQNDVVHNTVRDNKACLNMQPGTARVLSH